MADRALTKAERDELATAIAIRLECLRLANAAGALADVMTRAERYEDYILNGVKAAEPGAGDARPAEDGASSTSPSDQSDVSA